VHADVQAGHRSVAAGTEAEFDAADLLGTADGRLSVICRDAL
jgi:tRNA pseudouridine-54 N-methylase